MADLPKAKKEILMKLLNHEGLRYADAAPDGTANDLYNYHLQHLLKQGYIQKTGNLYSLTNSGKQFVESVHPLLPTGDTAELFRVNVLIILTKELDHQLYILNQTRKCHPYYGDKGIIGGPLRHAEPIEDAYARVLSDETGLTARCRTIGIIRKTRFTVNGDLFSDIFYHIGFATEHTGKLLSTTVYGDNDWARYEVAVEHERSSTQGGTSIVEILRRSDKLAEIPFFYYQERMTVKP